MTREEVVARCQGQLTRLDLAIGRWRDSAAGEAAPTAEQVREIEHRRGALTELLARDRFLELQAAIKSELEFLEQDGRVRRERAAAAAARHRLEERREKQATAALLKALQKSGRHIPQSLAADLARGASGEAISSSVLRDGFALLSAPDTKDTADLKGLAQRLKVNEKDRSFEAWLANSGLQQDSELEKLDAILAELTMLAGPETARPFEDRITALGEVEGGRQKLLRDSVLVDLTAALVDQRKRTALRQRIDEARAEFASLGIRTDEFAKPAADASTAELAGLSAAIEASISARRDAQAADARRKLVLKELAALGYEVGAQLSTAWVEDGKVVLRRPSQPGYGVEVAGGVSSERLQMRVVAFADAGTDVSRDRDAETRWCSDVDRLKRELQSKGAELVIEKALPVGAAAVKRVGGVSNPDAAPREAPAPRARTIN